MSVVPFDTLKLATKLEATGFTAEQARGAASALAESFETSSLVTSSDLRETVAELKVDLVRWLIVTQMALAGFVFAAIKFVK